MVIARQELRRLQAVLDKLPERQRSAIVMRKIHGLRHRHSRKDLTACPQRPICCGGRGAEIELIPPPVAALRGQSMLRDFHAYGFARSRRGLSLEIVPRFVCHPSAHSSVEGYGFRPMHTKDGPARKNDWTIFCNNLAARLETISSPSTA